MRQRDEALTELCRSVIEPLGYELLGVQYASRGKASALLRVYIDHPQGIALDDCVVVSRQLSAVLDVEDPLEGQYDLEVSSPGLDRPLFSLAHFQRFEGHRARLKLREKIGERRHLEGLLRGVRGQDVLLESADGIVVVPFAAIDSARLVPEL